MEEKGKQVRELLTLPSGIAGTHTTEETVEGLFRDLASAPATQDWILTVEPNAEGKGEGDRVRNLQSPDGRGYLCYTPVGADSGDDRTALGQPIVWSMAACLPPHLWTAKLEQYRDHSDRLIDGVVVRQPLWTLHLAGSVPIDVVFTLATATAALLRD